MKDPSTYAMKMLQTVFNTLNTKRERSGVEVATRLLGYDMHYTNSSFGQLHFVNFLNALTQQVLNQANTMNDVPYSAHSNKTMTAFHIKS